MRPLLPILLCAAWLPACGTTDRADGPAAIAPASTVDGSEESMDAVAEQLADLGNQKDAAQRGGNAQLAEQLEQTMQGIERAQDEALEEEFAGTPFDRATDDLPLGEPPLFVEQLVLDGTRHLVVRVKRKRFLCAKSENARLAAVQAYFEDADRVMREAGVKDFTLTVDAVRETAVVRPLARAATGGVRLTDRGRDTRAC